ncbi:MAG: N-acetyltransferase [Microcystis flos-aquae DF17]|nr:MAG: N-acetyltransferase [Microcystis flos-aquae DF17]
MTVLTTARLTLAPMTEAEWPELCALWSDPEFVRHIFPAGLSSEDVWTRLLRDVGHWAAVGYGNWAMRLTATGEYVGSVGVLDYRRVVDPPIDVPELGWGVAPRFQGQGLAGEAVRAALDWCDGVLKAPRTVCMISPENGPSRALAERVGYAEYVRTTYRGEPVILLERPRP